MSVGMTVGDLIGQLRAMEPKAVVVFCLDDNEEGCTPVASLERVNYFPITPIFGDIYEYNPDYQDAGEFSAVLLKSKK